LQSQGTSERACGVLLGHSARVCRALVTQQQPGITWCIARPCPHIGRLGVFAAAARLVCTLRAEVAAASEPEGMRRCPRGPRPGRRSRDSATHPSLAARRSPRQASGPAPPRARSAGPTSACLTERAAGRAQSQRFQRRRRRGWPCHPDIWHAAKCVCTLCSQQRALCR
jgi:hypothetical protein